MSDTGTDPTATFELIIALVAANWSALQVSLKCSEKVDSTRNILWGIDSNKKLKRKQVDHLLKYDVKWMFHSIVWILASVGIILLGAALYISIASNFSDIIRILYWVSGSIFIISSILVVFIGRDQAEEIEEFAREFAEIDKK